MAGDIQVLCNKGVFVSLPGDLAAKLEPLLQQLCAINYTQLAAELADVSGYNTVYSIVSIMVNYHNND